MVIGYLAGSVSLTRLIGRMVVPDERLESARLVDGDTEVLDRISPSRVGALAGSRWGVVAAIAEIGKVAFVTWWCRRRWPEDGGEAAMAGAVAGHTHPVFHGFRGGYGQSPIVGGMLVLDPWSIPVAGLAGTAASLVTGDEWLMQDGWPVILLPWALWRRRPALAAALAVANVVYLRVELPEYRRHRAALWAEAPTWAGRVTGMFERMGQERERADSALRRGE